MTWALEDTDNLTLDKISYTVGTGYGRVNVPFARRAITEIACHARGANFMYGPTVRTVLDMGGQDCKAIQCDEKGKVTNFLLNDKCAAGAGRGMEVFADLLGVSINDLGEFSLKVDEEPPMVSSTCVVFAKSEAVGLLRRGWSKEKVLAAYSAATVHRGDLPARTPRPGGGFRHYRRHRQKQGHRLPAGKNAGGQGPGASIRHPDSRRPGRGFVRQGIG